MVNLKIGFAKKRGTPSEVYSPDNGYEYRFENGMPFTDVIVEGSLSLNVGFSYGSTPRTNTFKFNVACSMAQAKVIEGYNYIVVYKDNKLVYCGYQPTFNKTIRNGVGKQGNKESWVELQVSYDDYSTMLKDVKFSKEEDFDLFYQASDGVKICDLENTEKSLIHILLRYLDPDSVFTVKFGKMPEILSTTVVQYFAVAYDDKVLSTLQDVLEQAGLAMYIVCQNIYILDVLETLTGDAVNIPNIESGATRQGKSYIDLRIPEIRMATARIATGMTIYDSGDMKMEGRDIDDVYRYYPDENSKMEASFSCAREDDVPNGKKTDEREKRYFNISEPSFYGQKVFGWGPSLYNYTKTSKGIKYGVRSECLLRCSWRLSVKGDVLLFKYDSAYKPDDHSLLNDDRKDCDYIFSADMAQRYANALRQQKVQSGTTYSFYADTDEAHPNGYDINSVVTIQGTDEANPLMLIISKTDNFDPFGGYNYKAVPYDREGVKISNSYIESKEALPRYSTDFTASLSRDVVECFRNRTPRDTSPITFTAKIKNPLITPQLKVEETPVDMTRKTEKVRGTDSQEGDAETDEWVYNIDPNLNGYDTCKLTLTVEDTTVNYLISKLIKDDPVPPEVIVPSDWKKVTQYAYGNEQGVIETDISKVESLELEFSEDGWVDEQDGDCPLRPFQDYCIWQRQGVYDPKTAKSPTEWTVVMWDIPYYRFDFAVNPSTYTINKRATDDVVNEIYLQPFINGYDTSTLIISGILDDGTNKATKDLSFDFESQRYLLAVPVKNAPSKSITISAKLGAISWEATLLPKDITSYNQYLGVFAENPPTDSAVEGDWYLNREDGKTYVLQYGVWTQLNDSMPNFHEMALSTLYDKFKKGSTVYYNEALVENLFVVNLTAHTVTGEYIGGQHIELLNEGDIYSNLYGTSIPTPTEQESADFKKNHGKGTVEALRMGTKDPNKTKTGFHMNDEGEAEFFDVDIYRARISDATLMNAIIEGELSNETFKTQKNDVFANKLRTKDITSGTAYWNTEEAINAIKGNNKDVLGISGSFNGNAYTSIIKLTDAERKEVVTLASKNNIQGADSISGTMPVKAKVTITGSPTTFTLNAKDGTKTVEYKLTGTTTGTYAKGTTIKTSIDKVAFGVFDFYDSKLQKKPTSTQLWFGGYFTETEWWSTHIRLTRRTEVKQSADSQWEYEDLGVYDTVHVSGDIEYKKPKPTTDWKVCTLSSDASINYVRWVYIEGVGELGDVWYETREELTSYDEGAYPHYRYWDQKLEDYGRPCSSGYGTYEFSTDGKTAKFTRDSLKSGETIKIWASLADKNSGWRKSTDADWKVSKAGILSMTYTRELYSEGINFMKDDGSPVDSISLSRTFLETSKALTCTGASTFDSSSAQKYYHYLGMEKQGQDSWSLVPSGEVAKLGAFFFKYQKYGEDVKTVASITSLKWTAGYITIIENREKPYTITSSDFLKSFSGEFTPIGVSRGNYTESIYPESPRDNDGDVITLGSSTNQFDEIYGKKIVGQLTGDVTGNVKGNLTGDSVSATTVTASGLITANGGVKGNLTGNVTGNVNAEGTSNKVWGAVFN